MSTRESGGAARSYSWLEKLALASMVVSGGVLAFVAMENRAGRQSQTQGPVPPPLPDKPLSLAGAATKGLSSASVVLIVFSDFQCPFCGRFAKDSMPELERVFIRSGRVLLAFRHLPLESIHPFARPAAESAWCAGREGRFWDMHDRLFQNPSRLDETSLRQHAVAVGLDIGTFDTCMAEGEAGDQVSADVVAARALGVSGTPAFLLGTRLPDAQVQPQKWLSGSLPFPELENELNRVLGRVRP